MEMIDVTSALRIARKCELRAFVEEAMRQGGDVHELLRAAKKFDKETAAMVGFLNERKLERSAP